MRNQTWSLLLGIGFSFTIAHAEERATEFAVPQKVSQLLTTYCGDCHGAKFSEAKVDLSAISKLTLDGRLNLLNKVQDQLFFKMMPPPDSTQLSATERAYLADWVRGELRTHDASKLDEKLRYPAYGNYVDHDLLFAGSTKEKPFTPARRWLVSPQIFKERIMDVFKLQAKERESFRYNDFYGVSNPFVLPEQAGVRYYDMTVLDGGHLLVMLDNAQWISEKQIRAARVKKGELKANEFENNRDRWYPKTTPDAFEKIILNKATPTEAEIVNAIQTQFDCVLQRPASPAEIRKYTELTQAAITVGGNTEGLRQMLVAVLLESEFLYRSEFGDGKPDDAGRLKLTPREAAYAIAYALGDRGPDPALFKAAEEGRLTTKEDYRREITRLIDDPNYYRGVIDPALSGLPTESTINSHPRFIRFFRDFFGYPMAVKVFKDSKRSGGHYVNADRGSTQTPGHLISEADKLVDWVLKRDQDVFKTLLTTDHFFVYHNIDNQKGAQLIANWKKAYELLKDTEWKTDPDKVAKEHQETIKKYLDPKGLPGKSSARHDNSVTRLMTHFEQSFGKGNNPFTITPWSHGNHYWYSPIYNLPKTPTLNERGPQVASQFNYQPVQPFPLANRKGILTHPAWLVAFSSNFHNDPVRRGRWIREKLLAGLVPDVPITVDAQVPEDPHHTLRERFEKVTHQTSCWKCHQHMNPLGFPFEIYDDFGRHRTVESREHPDNLIKASNEEDVYQTSPINAKGVLAGTGDPTLDGNVNDAFDLIDRLAKSQRVRQSIIRHMFRFFLGRNETLADSQTLIEADRAYVNSGGSFKAVVVSLLTSDSFIYRKPMKDKQ